MLRKRDVQFVEDYYEGNVTGLSKAAIRGRLYRLRNKIKKTLGFLTDLAKALPEPQKSQVFTADTLSPLVDALLSYEPDNKSKLVKNVRAFGLCSMFAKKARKGANMIKSPLSSTLISDRPGARDVEAVLTISYLMELTEKGS